MTDLLDQMQHALHLAIDAGDEPLSWALTHPAWAHLDESPIWRTEARLIHIGSRAARPLFQLPVDIVPGPHHHWLLRTACGATWEKDGRTPPPAAVVEYSTQNPSNGAPPAGH